MLRLLRHAYAAATCDDFAHTLTTELPRLIPSEVTSYNDIDPVRGRSLNWVEPTSVVTDERNRAWETHMGEHPVLRRYLATRDGRSLRISDFVSDRQFKQTGLYREHYVPLGCDQVLAIFLDVPAPRAVGVGLHRGGTAFTDREQLILEILRPHLRQAHQNAVAFSVVRRRLDLLVSQLATYVVSTDRHGQIRFATGDVVERIEGYLGHEREPGRLPAALDAWRAEQISRVLANDDVPIHLEPFVRESAAKRLVVRHLLDDDGSLLLVEERPLTMDDRALRGLGLTSREAEILALVAAGKTNADVSDALGVSLRTVEKHLEHVYAKLGVENRAAAVALAFSGTHA